MNASSTITTPAKTLLNGWERALLILPALAALVLGLLPLLLPKPFADLSQFPATDEYIYRLAGAATLGYGVALIIGLFQKEWRIVRLPVIGTLLFNLASLYACATDILRGHSPYSVYFVLVCSILFVTITSVLLARHAGVPRLEVDQAGTSSLLRIFLVVGAIAAGVFGVLPLFVPWFFKYFGFAIDAPFILQQAGAASLGYAVIAVLAQRIVNTRELFLIGIMAAIFNGAGGLASLPYIRGFVPLPQLIAPVGLLVLVGSLLFLRQAWTQKER
jgi:hypothetical protein